MNPKSHTLFHFTKSSETLKLVLKNGFWPRYCLEDVSWLGLKKYDFIAYPMVCFCDIPLSRVDEHVKFYGEFGLGLTNEWALSNGLNPVHYVSQNNRIPSVYKELTRIVGLGEEDSSEKGRELIRHLLAHTKPVEGNMVVASELLEKEFHQESEWRYIANHKDVLDHLSRSSFESEDKLEENNNKTKQNCMLKFSPNDVKYIFVKKDSDIPDIINFIQAELDDFPSSEVKVLLSRVTSLESIRRDM
ncbi:abortive infection system antitoxin AbiGi family protein [Marinobacter litoralis]|uniref:abortive infection system antitoxin AbiGi family protein n=1 Tax=Marinobacter litoralis TaxID=187981 RepID=UPI0018EB28B9|nr:abortive infection system antitoxin AbiGi family protein [Marinobacter litoralis]MBJ6136394.1 hypothetical protein [Marinobacter litoralis]